MANTAIYKEDWTTKLQETLDAPTFWKDVCRVDISTKKKLHNPYQGAAAASSLTRGTAYSYADWTLTDDNVDIATGQVVAEFIDRADLAQTGYNLQMERAVRQGEEINLTIEQAFLGDYANLTSFDNTEIGGGAGDITLSTTNVDDVVRAVKKKIAAANGQREYARNGGFIIWDPTTFEKLEAFAMANGFVQSDNALEGRSMSGFNYMGLTHYVSNSLTTETSTLHVVAGVKNMYHIGIYSGTFGKLMVDEHDPAQQSGIGIVSRVDYGVKAWNNVKPLLYNIQIVG